MVAGDGLVLSLQPVAQLSAPAVSGVACRDDSSDALNPELAGALRGVLVELFNCGANSGGGATVDPMLVQPLSVGLDAGGGVRPNEGPASADAVSQSGALVVPVHGGGATPPRLREPLVAGGATAVDPATGGCA
jgi:hypothetical protein